MAHLDPPRHYDEPLLRRLECLKRKVPFNIHGGDVSSRD